MTRTSTFFVLRSVDLVHQLIRPTPV